MSGSIWDDPRLAMPAGDYISFANPGDTVVGDITSIGVGTDYNGDPCPQLNLATDDGPKTVTAGQYDLKAQLAQLRPNAGDRIAIVFAQYETTPNGRQVKKFDIQVKAGSGQAPQPQPAPAPAPQPQGDPFDGVNGGPAPQQPPAAQSSAAAALL